MYTSIKYLTHFSLHETLFDPLQMLLVPESLWIFFFTDFVYNMLINLQ